MDSNAHSQGFYHAAGLPLVPLLRCGDRLIYSCGFMKRIPVIVFAFLFAARAETVSPLLARGHVVMPQPQVVRLGAGEFVFTGDWSVVREGVASSDAAVEVLHEELERRFHWKA